MDNNERPKNQTMNSKESMLKDILISIDKVSKNPEEKILLEDSIKNIIKETDIFIDHIREIDSDRRKEVLDIYNQILDKLKQRANNI